MRYVEVKDVVLCLSPNSCMLMSNHYRLFNHCYVCLPLVLFVACSNGFTYIDMFISIV